jgi:hypothetical protein
MGLLLFFRSLVTDPADKLHCTRTDCLEAAVYDRA